MLESSREGWGRRARRRTRPPSQACSLAPEPWPLASDPQAPLPTPEGPDREGGCWEVPSSPYLCIQGGPWQRGGSRV